uniref:Uncharacterized protein n=1 Tax=Streptomyces sp. NBC_00180 TaxID=2903632 RepID=A0AAU1IE70_9ACTN
MTFPDGSVGMISVKRGLSRDESDLIATRVWAELLDSDTSDDQPMV